MNNYKNVEYVNIGERTTVCCVTCNNGFEFVGSFCCKADSLNNYEFREQRAYENAIKAMERNRQRKAQDKK